jgi:hypothetical protein
MKTTILIVSVAFLSLVAGFFLGRYATVYGIVAISAYPIVCDDAQRPYKVSDTVPGQPSAVVERIRCEPFIYVRSAAGI